MKKLFLILGFFSILLSLTIVRAQVSINPQKTIKNVFVNVFGFPEEWLKANNLIFYGIIPFAAVWLIIFGFLDRLRIFKRVGLNAFLSFLIAFSTLPMRLFILIVATLFAVMGVYSVAIFAVIFMIGVFLFSKSMIWTWKREFGHYDMAVVGVDKQIDLIDKRIKKIDDAINKIEHTPGYSSTDIKFISEIDDLKNEKKKWEKRKDLLELKKKHINAEKDAARTFADLEENL